jgi:hypothetical protein
MSDASSGYGQGDVIGSDLSEDDRKVLRLWRESLTLLDGRYHDKVLLKLVARAMVDDEFRSRLVNDTDAVMGELEPGLPDGMDVRFFANTPTTVNVVLPPRAGEMENRSGALRDALRSRTSGDALGFFEDDWDISDAGGIDPPIFLPPEDDAGVPDPPPNGGTPNGGTR